MSPTLELYRVLGRLALAVGEDALLYVVDNHFPALVAAWVMATVALVRAARPHHRPAFVSTHDAVEEALATARQRHVQFVNVTHTHATTHTHAHKLTGPYT